MKTDALDGLTFKNWGIAGKIRFKTSIIIWDMGSCTFTISALNESRFGEVTAFFGRSLLDNGHWKGGILIGILTSMNLMKCHRVVIFRYPVSTGLNVFSKGHSHEAIYYFIEDTETGLCSSLFKCLQ